MNPYFMQQAVEKESRYFRKYGKKGKVVYTLKTFKGNVIEKVTEKYVYLRSEKRENLFRISRATLRNSLKLFLYRRTITLKQLIRVHSFSSALGALIHSIMIEYCKVIVTKTGAVRMTLRGVRYFFSGVSRSLADVQIAHENNARFVLLNYASIKGDIACRWKKNLRDLGYDYRCVMLDPGEKTIHDAMCKGRDVEPIDLMEYAAFVIRHSDIIFQYLTVDRIGDPLTTMRNTLLLEQIVGRRPIPIYHIQSPLEALQELVDADYDVIAIGGSALRSVSHNRRIEAFDEIFKRYSQLNFHALGLGSIDLLLNYPWVSADSSSWLSGRIYRKLITLAGRMEAPFYMSSREAMGYNVKLLASLEEKYGEIQTSYDLYFP